MHSNKIINVLVQQDEFMWELSFATVYEFVQNWFLTRSHYPERASFSKRCDHSDAVFCLFLAGNISKYKSTEFLVPLT